MNMFCWTPSVFPINFVFGQVVIPSHLIFQMAAFYVGLKYYGILKEGKKDFIEENKRFLLLIAAAGGALIGSRFLGALEHPRLFFDPPSVLYYFEVQTIVGALLGGLLAVEAVKKILKEHRSTGDLFTYPLIVGMMIGRIGCFLTGVQDGVVGNPSSLPWALDQGDGILRHPTAIYEILFLFVVWRVLLRLEKRFSLRAGAGGLTASINLSGQTPWPGSLPEGSLFKLFMISYLSFRLLIEFIKPVEPLGLGLSAIQWACFLGLVYYAMVVLRQGLVTRA